MVVQFEQSQQAANFWNGQEVLAKLNRVDEVPFALTPFVAPQHKATKLKRIVGQSILSAKQVNIVRTDLRDMVQRRLP